ncbi:hypothetical protein Vadar_024216 [Vaccinium darrowii]|uniref:Uncharacterized protein n=1 Tax=Vaccinium darrowii TaxID=229202 RepID=A0ACB7YP20_9ERIC|nr:hypothetical protein Vadar_024216 [Vaccinium darrowii]
MFHPSMAGGLVNLKKLLIKDCLTLEAVVGKEEEAEGGHERKKDKVEFPQLESLELCDLPNLLSLYPNVNTALPKSTNRLYNSMQPQSLFNEKVAIPSLKYLKLLGLNNVSDLWCSELPSSSFSKVENLEVISCASLRNMFNSSMSRGLVNLEELLIEVCSTLEVVVGKEEVVRGGHGSKIDKTLFPLLGQLKLGSLPNLKRFCNSTHPLKFPKLSQMDILFCPSMDAFSSEPVCAPNLTLPGISWNGDLNNAIQFLQKNGNGLMARSMEKPRTFDDVTDKFKPWQVAETQCRLVAMPDSTDKAQKVVRLIYTNSGDGVLALGCNGIIRLWKWGGSQHNPSGMATASVVPQEWQPASGLAMTNDVIGAKLEEAVPYILLVNNDSEVFSACGGMISIFNKKTFKVMKKFMPPPPTSTFLALSPLGSNFIAIGREDSTICIYDVMKDKVLDIVKGHQKPITGLAISTNLNIMVSSGADAQLAIYDASKMDQIRQWVPQDVLPAPISSATYSCDSQLVYTSFCDGHIGVFDADSLVLRCYTEPSIYLPTALLSQKGVEKWNKDHNAVHIVDEPSLFLYLSLDCLQLDMLLELYISDQTLQTLNVIDRKHTDPPLAICCRSQAVYPLVVAAHPQQPNQFAVGLTNGSVIVMELPTITGLDGATVSSSNASNQTPDPVLDEDVDGDLDEDALITTRTRTRTATAGTHDDEEDLEEVLNEDVDEDALITTRTRTRIATTGTHDDKEDLEEKRKKEEEEEERKKKKGKAPLLDEDEEY